MLIEFNIKNFKSFKDLNTLSLVASSDDRLYDSNVFKATFPQAVRSSDFNLLKSAVIYGANASGKSNLLQAILFMKWFIQNSHNLKIGEDIPVSSFKLRKETENKPSFFEIFFIYKNIRYRYGFEVDTDKVHNEWLFFTPRGKEAKLFTREGKKFVLGTYFKEGKNIQEKTKKNTLFLSVVAQFNGEISTNIITWYKNFFNVITGIDDSGYLIFTFNKIKDQEFKDNALQFLKIADVGIDDISLLEKDLSFEEIPDNVKQKFLENIFSKAKEPNKIKITGAFEASIVSSHKKYDKLNKVIDEVSFLLTDESLGTQKILALTGPIIDTLQNGKILVIDEFETRLHPIITRFIINMFNSKKNNPQNAQLIFATHDTNLLDNRFFRRDQIWFTEKNRYGETELYSLFDYKIDSKKTRPDATHSKDYILGKYGAIPIIGDPSSIIGE